MGRQPVAAQGGRQRLGMRSGAGGSGTGADHLIVEFAMGMRLLTAAEIQQVVQEVAQVGFNPLANTRAKGLSGVLWQGQTLTGSTRITAGERHYLDHVVQGQEWPPSTTLQNYYDSLRAA